MTASTIRSSLARLARLPLGPPPSPSARALSTSSPRPAGAKAKPKQLCGSAPNYDRHVVVLGQPSAGWPSHLESVSPLARAMSGWFRKPGLEKVGVTFGERDESGRLAEGEERWDNKRSKFMEPVQGGKEE